MKKIHIILFIGLAILGTSCKDYLDINTNPNKPTSVAPELILPQALKITGDILNTFNSYGMQIGGYGANAGGYGGFGSSITYAFSSTDYAGIWSASYDNLEDYQYIITNTEGQDNYLYFNAASKIMKAHGFQLLVDTYNDIPYTEALKGSDNLTPAYDPAAAVYADLAVQLDDAITLIKQGQALDPSAVMGLGTYDVLFGGDMDSWIELANTLKLKLMVKAFGKVTFTPTTFTDGFLTEDALINPGYTRDNNKQNPVWNTWAFAYTGSAGNKAWMPNRFAFTFYDSTKLYDPIRAMDIYYTWNAPYNDPDDDGVHTGSNQLGYENVGVQSSPTGSFWYASDNRVGTAAGGAHGVLKGPTQGMPVITLAETEFLLAEAALKGIAVPGTAKAHFNAGILASFTYLDSEADGTLDGDPAAEVLAYKTNNASSYLVNYDGAATPAQQLEAIITQKWIAMNMVNSNVGWDDYRRTGYPAVVAGSTNPTETFASLVSQSTRADKLPSRIQYPNSEATYNPANVPSGINTFSSTIFWAK